MQPKLPHNTMSLTNLTFSDPVHELAFNRLWGSQHKRRYQLAALILIAAHAYVPRDLWWFSLTQTMAFVLFAFIPRLSGFRLTEIAFVNALVNVLANSNQTQIIRLLVYAGPLLLLGFPTRYQPGALLSVLSVAGTFLLQVVNLAHLTNAWDIGGSVVLIATSLISSFVGVIYCYALETDLRMFYSFCHGVRSRPELNIDTRHLHFFNPAFRCPEDDKPLMAAASSKPLPVVPIFVTGFHRSGTTFLFDKVVSLCGGKVARLDPYGIVHYPRLVTAVRAGTVKQEQDNLSRFFVALGIHDRVFDRVKVTATEPPEEYNFVLSKYHLRGDTRASANGFILKELVQKLCMVQQPHPEGMVVLKNPWDYGREAELLEVFPNAKFVHITRDPLEVVNSMYSAAKAIVLEFDAYFWLLLPFVGKIVISAEHLKAWWKGTHASLNRILVLKYSDRSCCIGPAYFPYLAKTIVDRYVDEAHKAEAALKRIPREVVHTVSYKQLVEQPAKELEIIGRFLGSFISS